jgi:hypothetical protein
MESRVGQDENRGGEMEWGLILLDTTQG